MNSAITTFWESDDNYGSLLQNYAMQKFLNAHGIGTCLIRAKFGGRTGNLTSDIKSVLKKYGAAGFVKKAASFVPRRIFYKNVARKNALRNFEEFRNARLNPTRVYPTVQDLKDDPPAADIYITGSDQVWNLFCAPEAFADDFADLYFLNFGGETVRRAACSACICKNEVFPDFEEKLSALVSRFEFVSTRESFGAEWCRRLGYKNARHQPDPSFLLSKNDWKTLYGSDKSFLPKRRFALLYLLNNKCDFSVSDFKAWARRNGLAAVYVSGNEAYLKPSAHKKFYATIPQWLELFDSAECVFTNSFHGTVFSLIYNRKFMTVEQRGRWEYSNSRVYDLLDFFGLRGRIFTGDFDPVKNEIDFGSVNARLEKIRAESPFVLWADRLKEGADK